MKNFVEGLTAPQTASVIEANLVMLRQESIATDLFSRFVNTFEGIKNAVTKTLNGVLNDSNLDKLNRSLKTISSDFRSNEAVIDSINYVVLSTLPIPCPDGFDKDFAGYVTSLESVREALIKTALVAVSDFNTYLASFIGNKSSKISLQDNGRHYASLAKQREKQNELFLSFFSTGVNQRQTLAKMFKTKEEIKQAISQSIRTFETTSKINLEGLAHDTKVMAERMNLIIEHYHNSSDQEVSKQTLLNLSEGAHEVACQIEHLALFVARTEIAAVTSGNIVHRLKEAAK